MHISNLKFTVGAAMTGQPAPASATTTSAPEIVTSQLRQRAPAPRVEEVSDDE